MLTTIILWIIYTLIYGVAWIACYILAPFAAFTADEDGRLITGLGWMETFDNLGWSGPLSEPVVRATSEKWGRRIGLTRWLMRNKAYTLRYNMGRFHDGEYTYNVKQFGGDRGLSAKWETVEQDGKIMFEFEPQIAVSKGRFYFRIGWKVGPKIIGTFGMFTGLTPRLDDWDDLV